MMTKEDYMFLPKERLAELLAERDTQIDCFIPHCYSPDGICTNPLKDCINCPKQFDNGTTITTTNTLENLIEGCSYSS